MNRTFKWFSLFVGAALLAVGVRIYYLKSEWTLLVLSMLIIAFSLSGILKKGPGPGPGNHE